MQKFTVADTVREETSKIKVACVGDSITYGVLLDDRENNSYPSVLQKELGDGFDVGNFGVSATSALKNAREPYVNTPQYSDSLEFAPDVLCIMLGTNDIKDENWIEGKDNFKSDYLSIIESYKVQKPDLKVYMGIPPAILKADICGKRDPAILENEAIPQIKELALEIGAVLVDIHSVLDGRGDLLVDFLHPKDEGAIMIGKAFAAKLKEKGR